MGISHPAASDGKELSKPPRKGLSPCLEYYSVIDAGRYLAADKPECKALGLQGAMVKSEVAVV